MEQRDISSAKFTAPDVSSFAIDRALLVARLDEALLGPRGSIVLVSAPAGFGKTTLLADWSHRATNGTSVAWCSLDATDVTAYRLWGLVLRALDAVGAGMRGAPPRRAATSFPSRLAGHLSTRPDVVLVLDNVQHVRDASLLDDLGRLLDGVAERGRVVILTRHDPVIASVQRHRLAGRLLELRTADLAFTRAETSQVCRGLDPADQESAWQASEGWPAVLRLYELASRTPAGPRLPAAVLEQDVALADYVFGETLSSLPEETQQLLMLSAVPVLLPLDLAVELTGHHDVGEQLDGVAHRTGLITKFPGSAGALPSYRFHPILRSHLRGRLDLQDLPRASRGHACAAIYFLRTGRAAEAVQHAVSSSDVTVLDTVLADCGAGLVNAGEADLLVEVLQTALRPGGRPAGGVSGWPGPWTYAVLAAAKLDLGMVPQAAGTLATAHAARAGHARDGAVFGRAGPGGASALDVLLSAAEVHLRRRRGESAPEVHMLLEPAMGVHPELRLLLAVQRGTALMWRGDWRAAELELTVGADLARGLERDAALIDCLTGLAFVHAARSSVPRARELVEEALWLARSRGWTGTPRVAFAHVLAAWAAWQELSPERARDHMDSALSVLDLHSDPTIVIAARVLDAALEHEAERSPESAERLHSVWQAFDTREAAPSLVAYAVLTDMRFSLGLHRVGWAHDVLELVRRRIPGSGEVRLLDAMVAESSRQMSRARQLVEDVAAGATPTVVPSTRIEAHSAGARMALREGDTRSALEHARSALGLVAELGCMRPVVDAGGPELLELLRGERGRWGALENVVESVLKRGHRGALAIGEQLTAREMDILRELSSMRTVEEIGAALHLSGNTVKTHLKGVYRKLGVGSRREAISEGRRVGLL